MRRIFETTNFFTLLTYFVALGMGYVCVVSVLSIVFGCAPTMQDKTKLEELCEEHGGLKTTWEQQDEAIGYCEDGMRFKLPTGEE